jgi:hypothetical protein
MSTGIQPEKLDDIQLSLYLAQKHYGKSSHAALHVMNCADQFYDWIKEKRAEQTEENRTAIQELLNNK